MSYIRSADQLTTMTTPPRCYLATIPHEILLKCLVPITAVDLANACHAFERCRALPNVENEAILWRRHTTVGRDIQRMLQQPFSVLLETDDPDWFDQRMEFWMNSWTINDNPKVWPHNFEVWKFRWQSLGPMVRTAIRDLNLDVDIFCEKALDPLYPLDFVSKALAEIRASSNGAWKDFAGTFDQAVAAHKHFHLHLPHASFAQYSKALLKMASGYLRIHCEDLAYSTIASDLSLFCDKYGMWLSASDYDSMICQCVDGLAAAIKYGGSNPRGIQKTWRMALRLSAITGLPVPAPDIKLLQQLTDAKGIKVEGLDDILRNIE